MSGIMSMLLGARTAIAAAVDEFFNRVTLLLPGDGTNGAQNNTFLDSSTNNFSITRNGNSTQGTFSPFSQTGWSNYFLNTGSQNLSAVTGSDTSPGTGDFCAELWYWSTTTSGNYGLFGNLESNTDTQWGIVLIQGSSLVRFQGWNTTFVSGTEPARNAWNHVAVCRSGTTMSMFINGTRAGTATVSNNFSATTNIRVGGPNGIDYFLGYISNARFVKGSSVYDPSQTSITVPTSPLTAITNTKFLTCQNNRFVDNSSTGYAITPNGTPSVQAFSPFAPTAAYDAATVGGSGYFDGTGDYLSCPTSNTTLHLGSGDYTVEAWVYTTTVTQAEQTILSYGTSVGQFRLQINNANFRVLSGPNLFINFAGAVANTWMHVAVVRSGSGTNSTKLYLNGVQIGQGNDSTNWNSGTATIGGDGASRYFFGYIGSMRIVKTQALTSGAFTPPTAPATTTSVGWTGANAASSITGTVPLLLNFTNAGITDATAKNVLETVGNAQISTAQSKFGGSSMLFDGTGDYLNIPTTNQSLTFGSANWTIEFWLYLPSLPSTRKELLYLNGNTSGYAAVALHICSNNKLGLSFSESGSAWKTDDTTGVGNALSATTWQYIAVTRNGQNIQIYVDGAAQGSAYTTTAATTSLMTTYTLNQVGAYNSASFQLNAYIDDLRITRGEVRTVTSSPTAAFPLQ
jgi:hypothetical protein